jgi:hypothetical protein
MFHIVLVEPEIPPNTGNVIRLAANTGCGATPTGRHFWPRNNPTPSACLP